MIPRAQFAARIAARAKRRAERAAAFVRSLVRRGDHAGGFGLDPAVAAERKENAERIDIALRKLTELDRVAVILRDLEGRSTREAALVVYGADDPRTLNAFTHRLGHARKRLRAFLVVEFEVERGDELPRWDAEVLLRLCARRAAS